MTDTTEINVPAVLHQAIGLCRDGYASGSPDNYARIDELLATLPQGDAITACRRLAQGGPDLSSKRFAYPHIEDRLEDELALARAA